MLFMTHQVEFVLLERRLRTDLSMVMVKETFPRFPFLCPSAHIVILC